MTTISNAPYIQHNPISLEEEFENQALCKIDINQDCGFKDYLVPNEYSPELIEQHLILAQQVNGIIVSVGTERSFTDLLLSNKTTCEGLLVRDINPKVKAYVDFNVLLLRISKTKEEYQVLSQSVDKETNPEAFQERMSAILEKINTSNFPKNLKDYYIENYVDFGLIYLSTLKAWRSNWQSEYFVKVRYDQNDEQFFKLKSYADSGNIISTMGMINDLSFLEKRRITTIDTSNICDYIVIDLEGKGDFHPRVIWTRPGIYTQYNSYVFTPMSASTKNEMKILCKSLIDIVSTTTKKGEEGVASWLQKSIAHYKKDPFNRDLGSFYNENSLTQMKAYIQSFFVNFPKIGAIDIGNADVRDNMGGNGIVQLSKLTLEEIHQSLENPKIASYLPMLIDQWVVFQRDLRKYIAFSKVDGWTDEFKKHLSQDQFDFPDLVINLTQQNLLEEFINAFASEEDQAFIRQVISDCT